MNNNNYNKEPPLLLLGHVVDVVRVCLPVVIIVLDRQVR